MGRDDTWRSGIHGRELAFMSGGELACHVSLQDRVWAMLPSSSIAQSLLLLSLYHTLPRRRSNKPLSRRFLSLDPMVSQRCCSSDSSAYSSEEAGVERWAADRMVKIELEAAEALADLALLATREPEAGLDSGEKWGSKGKRAMKRVKGESPVGKVESAHRCSTDRSQDRAIVNQELCDDLGRDVVMKTIKAEQEAELLRPCSTSYSSFGGGRSRQNLTEAEKEARRIRRILANRESARQTIRRRQALCEDLAKKAADLSWENESLKKEKELALKEYQSLETTNRHLKEKVAQATKTEVEETQGGAPTSPPTNCNLYNRLPFTPLFWPAIVQSNNAQSQNGDQNAACLTSNGSVSATGTVELFDKQENLIHINGSRTPLYLLPCPWFIPLPDHGNGHHPRPFFGVMNKQDENSASNQNSACASSNVTIVEMNNPTFCMKAETTNSGSVEVKHGNDLKETLVRCSQNGDGYGKSDQSNEMFLAPAPCSSTRPAFTDKDEKSDLATSPASQIATSLSEQNRRLMDAIAAAEARRRRKELTKLKNFNGRQCRTHC